MKSHQIPLYNLIKIPRKSKENSHEHLKITWTLPWNSEKSYGILWYFLRSYPNFQWKSSLRAFRSSSFIFSVLSSSEALALASEAAETASLGRGFGRPWTSWGNWHFNKKPWGKLGKTEETIWNMSKLGFRRQRLEIIVVSLEWKKRDFMSKTAEINSRHKNGSTSMVVDWKL